MYFWYFQEIFLKAIHHRDIQIIQYNGRNSKRGIFCSDIIQAVFVGHL